MLFRYDEGQAPPLRAVESESHQERPTGGGGATDLSVPLGADGRWRHWMLVTALLSLDLLFLLGNLIHLTSNDPGEPTTPFSTVQWNGDTDGSYVEIFGHTQLLAGVVMLAFLSVLRRSYTFVAWIAVLIALVADDFFQIHESVGSDLVLRLGLPAVAGLRPQDLGELLVWGALALTLGCALILSYLFSSQADRRHSRSLFGWLCLLAVFAVAVDQLHIILEPHVSYTLALAITLIETTGELVGMTLIVLAIHRMTLQTGVPLR